MRNLFLTLAVACAACGLDALFAETPLSQPLTAAQAHYDLPYAWYAFDAQESGQVTTMNILLANRPDLCARLAERGQFPHVQLTLWPQGPRVPNGGKIPSSMVRAGHYPVQARLDDAGYLVGTLYDGTGQSLPLAKGEVEMAVVQPEAHDLRGTFDMQAHSDDGLVPLRGRMQLQYCGQLSNAR